MNSSVWISTAETDIGTVRKVNEDDYYEASEARLWCVADGMGGHTMGDYASQLITETLSKLVSSAKHDLSLDNIITCVNEVNSKLISLSEKHHAIIGSTVVILFIKNEKAHVLWAGDSRIYRLRNNKIDRMTRDHSQVEYMVEAGMIKPEEAASHPKANVITRAVGASLNLNLEVRTLDLQRDDQFLLCSDGLNKVMSDAELEHALINVPSSDLARYLIEIALARKADDNVTVLAVRNNGINKTAD